MADEETVETGQSEQTEPVETPEVAAKPQPAEDPRFAGKSREEVIAIAKEQDRYIGRQGNALGEVQSLKQSVTELQNYIAARDQRERQSAPAPVGPEFDLLNPGPYVYHIASQIVNERDQQRNAWEQQRMMTEAQTNYMEGKEDALGRNPELFAGIENDVERAITASFANRIISPAALRSPKTWELAAKVLRIERGEDDKLVTRRSMKAVEVEKPGKSTGPDDEEIILDEQDREEMKRQGWTEKEAKEIIRLELDARRKGLSRDRKN